MQTEQAGPSNAGTSEEPMEVTDTESCDEHEPDSENQSATLNRLSQPLSSSSQSDFPRELELCYQELDSLNK